MPPKAKTKPTPDSDSEGDARVSSSPFRRSASTAASASASPGRLSGGDAQGKRGGGIVYGFVLLGVVVVAVLAGGVAAASQSSAGPFASGVTSGCRFHLAGAGDDDAAATYAGRLAHAKGPRPVRLALTATPARFDSFVKRMSSAAVGSSVVTIDANNGQSIATFDAAVAAAGSKGCVIVAIPEPLTVAGGTLGALKSLLEVDSTDNMVKSPLALLVRVKDAAELEQAFPPPRDRVIRMLDRETLA